MHSGEVWWKWAGGSLVKMKTRKGNRVTGSLTPGRRGGLCGLCGLCEERQLENSLLGR